MTAPTPLIAGNWKMHGLTADLAQARAVAEAVKASHVRVAICPPATLLGAMSLTLQGTAVLTGGQDCHAQLFGAFTGDVSAEMIHDAGGALVILGHSERRAGFGETNEIVAGKVQGALRAGLEPIVCVGETIEQRKAGRALEVVNDQLRGSLPPAIAERPFAVAYEPVWAIGTGLTPSIPEIEEVHRAIRATLAEMFGEAGRAAPILYGGSVKPSNAAEILRAEEVGGALVGGASLKAEDFLAIIEAAPDPTRACPTAATT